MRCGARFRNYRCIGKLLGDRGNSGPRENLRRRRRRRLTNKYIVQVLITTRGASKLHYFLYWCLSSKGNILWRESVCIIAGDINVHLQSILNIIPLALFQFYDWEITLIEGVWRSFFTQWWAYIIYFVSLELSNNRQTIKTIISRNHERWTELALLDDRYIYSKTWRGFKYRLYLHQKYTLLNFGEKLPGTFLTRNASQKIGSKK